MQKYDFVIIGYGPVGATLANLLGCHGFSVAIVDRYAAVYDKPRAITVDHEAMRCFQAAGLADAIAPIIGIHRGTDYVGVDNQVIKIFNPAPSPFPLGWPPAITFVQPELERLLRDGLRRFEQVEEFLGYDAKIVEQQDGLITVSLSPFEDQAQGSAPEQISGKYLLACDGANSPVRTQFGMGLEDLGFNEWWLVVDAHGRDMTKLPERAHQYCRPSRPGTHIIGPGMLRRWEIKLLPGETPEDFRTEDAIRKALATFVDPDAVEIWRSAVYQFHAVVADRWREGNIFLAGDAAHRTPPFLGQGLCAGLRDANNLFWKFVLVERRGASDSLLDTYRAERRPHVKTVVAHAKEFGLIIGELDEAKARQRDARLEAELKAGTAETIRSRFIPDLAGGLLARAGDNGNAPLARLAGSLFVQPKVLDARGEEKFLDDVTGNRFAIFAAENVVAALPTSARTALQRLGGHTTVVSSGVESARKDGDVLYVCETDGLFANWCAQHGVWAALVRPDRYVYGVAANAQDLTALVDALHAGVFENAGTI